MNKIRVLIVDDSFVMRTLLAEILNVDPEIEVVGMARDGETAIKEAKRLKPDAILMDYLLPKIDGAQATEQILKSENHPPAIIMISAFTKEGAEVTLKSLRLGVADFVLKPSGEVSLDIGKVRVEIISKIKIAVHARILKFHRIKEKKVKKIEGNSENVSAIVVIGASTGGPPLIENILEKFPSDFGATILVVQHMPKHFTETFSERINKISPLVVREAQEGETIKTSHAFIAPGNMQMEIEKVKKIKNICLKINLIQELKSCHSCPSIDVTMISLAYARPSKIIGVILTGMGEDGLKGMKAIKAVGGHTIVQDPKTAAVDSMPKAVIEAKLADEVLPPEKIAEKIMELIR